LLAAVQQPPRVREQAFQAHSATGQIPQVRSDIERLSTGTADQECLEESRRPTPARSGCGCPMPTADITTMPDAPVSTAPGTAS
jgi:hypothetical protein